MCACGRARTWTRTLICDICASEMLAAFWAQYDVEAREWRARQAAKEVRTVDRPGTPGSVRAAVRVTARGLARY